MHKGASEWPSDKQGEEGRSLPWRCGRALVTKLGVGTVAGEVPQLATLVAAQVGVVAAPHAAAAHPGAGLCHLNTAVAYHAVGKGQDFQYKVGIHKHIKLNLRLFLMTITEIGQVLMGDFLEHDTDM